jgi:phage-related protein
MAFQAMGIDLVAVFQTIKEFFTVFWADITAAFQWAVDGVRNVWNTAWNAVRDFVAPIWGSVKTTISESLGWILTKFKEWTAPLTNAWNSLWTGVGTALTTVWEGVKSTIKASINWIISKVNSVIESINSVARKGAGVIGFTAPQIPTVPMLANGGIVNRPTLAMIGEAGPEAVVPLRGGLAMAGAGFGGITIQITGNTFMGEEGIADRIGKDIMRAIKTNVRL